MELRLAATLTQPTDTTWGAVVGPSSSRCIWNPDTVGKWGTQPGGRGGQCSSTWAWMVFGKALRSDGTNALRH